MTIKTLTPTDQRATAEGTGTQAALAPGAAETIVIVRNFQPGQVVRVIFITPDQAKQLPTLPADALQIAVAPSWRPLDVSQAIYFGHRSPRPLPR